MVGALGNGEQRACADPAELAVVPARQRFGAGQAVLGSANCGWKTTSISSPSIACSRSASSWAAVRPGRVVSPSAQASRRALLAAHVGKRLAEPVEHRIRRSPARPRATGRCAATGAGSRRSVGNRAGDEIGQLPGEQLPALAAAGFIGDQHEIAAARRAPPARARRVRARRNATAAPRLRSARHRPPPRHRPG